MPMTFDVRNRNVTVVGAGRSGGPAAELLVRRGARVTLADTAATIAHEAELSSIGVRLELGPHRADQFVGADLVVLSPGVDPAQSAIAAARTAGVPVIGEVELASRWLQGRVIAITGTKGKSTTTTLTSLMLRAGGFDAPAGGNLGTALSSQVAASTPSTIHVVEVSSFQLETTDTFHPWISVFVNLSPDHLDRHASFEAYRAAKARIFARQTPQDWAVINADDAGARDVAPAGAGAPQRLDYTFDSTIANGVTVEGGTIVRRVNGVSTPLVPLTAVQVPGRHILSDVLAASAVASLVGVPAEAMTRAVANFQGLEHALQRVAVVGGVQFINDSKATNVAAATRAIESFGDGLVVILGGKYKGGDFGALAAPLRERRAAVVAIGEARPLIHAALDEAVPVHDADSMEDAVRKAARATTSGGTVLLAPACSSFDMFRDYTERGRAFVAAVQKWEGTTAM